MKLKRLGVVFRKEVVDGIRDRRALYSVVIGALVGPLLVGFMFSRIAERQREARDITIPIIGAEYAPALVDWLRQQEGVTISEGPEDAEEAVREQDEDLVLVISEEFGQQFTAGKGAEVQLVTDGSRDNARVVARRVRGLLGAYNAQIATLRLIARGVSPAVASPLKVEDVEVSTTQQRAARILSFIPLYIILAAFTGGMQIATDSTAGERERGSLESLLVNPVSRETIVAGKWLASVLFALVTMVLTAILCAVVMDHMPLQDLGIRLRMGPETAIGVTAATLPTAFLASSLQVFIASFARSFKEAQSYLSMLIMFAMLPGLLPVFYPITNQLWLSPIPLVGQNLLLTDVFGGKEPGVLPFVLAAVSAMAFSLILVYLTTRLFRKERVIFGR